MSAWIVNRDHLDLLLTAAIDWNLTDADTADDTGRMLWAENLESVAYRYPNHRSGQRPGPDDFRDADVATYTFRTYPGRIDPQIVLSAAESLTCQSCEHPGWDTSPAHAWVDRLTQQAADRVPAYLTEHGPVDPALPLARDHGWYVVFTGDGAREVRCTDGWAVPDRDVFNRAANLRTTPVTPVS